jgi:hypothetical protein
MVYLIQAEEPDISFDCLQELAAALIRPPEVTFADATHLVHNAHGIFELPDTGEAERVAQAFVEVNFPTFTLESLLPLPPPKPLNLHRPEIKGGVQLAIAGQVRLVREELQPKPSPALFSRVMGLGSRSRIDESTLEHDTIWNHLEIFTDQGHWQARAEVEIVLVECLSKLTLAGAFLSVGVRHLLEKNRRLPLFNKEADYNRYVTWLYQVRYARNSPGPVS